MVIRLVELTPACIAVKMTRKVMYYRQHLGFNGSVLYLVPYGNWSDHNELWKSAREEYELLITIKHYLGLWTRNWVSCQTHIKFNYHLERQTINTFYGMFIYRCSNGGKPVVTNAYKTIKIHNSRCEFCRSLDPHHHRGSEMTNYHMEGLNSTLVLFSKTIVVYNFISISSTTYSYTA